MEQTIRNQNMQNHRQRQSHRKQKLPCFMPEQPHTDKSTQCSARQGSSE